MKITHNHNNRWQDEAKTFELDEDLYPWVEALVEAVRKEAYEKARGEGYDEGYEKAIKEFKDEFKKYEQKYGVNNYLWKLTK